MKQETTNLFNKGLLMDLNPLTTPNNVLTNCLNGTFITFNGNDVILQNDMGNGRVESAKLPAGYVPLGVKEYGGIIYIVSYNPFTKKGQVGSFPSPERNFDNDEYENVDQRITNVNFFKDSLEQTVVKRYLNDQEIVKVGDLFEVCLIDNENLGETNILTILSNIKELNSTGINKGKKILNVKVAAIDNNNNITYLNLDDKDYKDSGNIILGKFLTLINKDITNLDYYEAYTYSRNCKLLVIAELESLDSFDLHIKTISDNKYIYQFDAKIEPYDFWRWLEINIFYKENNETGEHKVTKIIKNIYDSDFNAGVYDDNIEVKPGITDPLFPTLAQNGTENNISFYGEHLTSNKSISWTLEASSSNTIIDYEIIPHMTYGPANNLKKTGRLNVNHYNDTYVELIKWKYKTENDILTIDWGIDYNSTTIDKLYRIDFSFFEIKYDNPSTLTVNAGGLDQYNNPIYSEYLSSDYVTSINLGSNTLQKNKLYLCTISYYTINNINESTLNPLSNWKFWQSEKRFVYTNNLMDQYYNQFSDFNLINPNNSLRIVPQTLIRRNTTDELYNPPILLSYNSTGSFTSNATKTTNIDVDINAKGISQHDIDFEINWNSINLNINPTVLPTIINKVTHGNILSSIVTNRNQQNSTLVYNKTNQLYQYNGSNTFTEKEINPNILLDVNEIVCSNNIDDDSLFELSRRFKIDLVEKSLFTSNKKLNNSSVNVYVLDKYYSHKNFRNIFGYQVPEDVNGYPIPTKAYTDSQAHFFSKGGLFTSAEYLPNETLDLKTYVEFPIVNPVTGNPLINWNMWSDVNNSQNTGITISSLPSISILTSKCLSPGLGYTIRMSSDYLVGRISPSGSAPLDINWCYPMLKDNFNNYLLVHISRTPKYSWEIGLPVPIGFSSAGLNFKNMFDNKYLFQETNLNNLYIPDPNTWTYNTYTVNNTISVTPSGSISNINYYVNSTLVTNNNVSNCLSHNFPTQLVNVDYSNVSITSAYTFESQNIPISIDSCDFSKIISTGNNLDVLKTYDALFKIQDGELLEITNTLDGSGNLYNKENYYIYSDNVYKTGNGIWVTNIVNDPKFRELVINSGKINPYNYYGYAVGKVVSDYEGGVKLNMFENVLWSEHNGSHYTKLQDKYTIFPKPLNWD